jgi:hypothetical protein
MDKYKIYIILLLLGILLYVNSYYKIAEYFTKNNTINKTIWLLWFQGWDNAPYLQKIVAESWVRNNPTWKVEYLDIDNLKNYITDVDYIYDETKHISYQAKSDIIRLSLLKNHGGVWADSTFLCMQPLDSWIYKSIEASDFWMYHGNGAGMDIEMGPASWFIVSKKGSYIITKWKEKCDYYWNSNNSTDNYFWMDSLFKELVETDEEFTKQWKNVLYLNCEDDGSSHTLANYSVFSNNEHIKKLMKEKPPFGLKFWKDKSERLENCHNDYECINSNGAYAIEMSKRSFSYNHFNNLDVI